MANLHDDVIIIDDDPPTPKDSSSVELLDDSCEVLFIHSSSSESDDDVIVTFSQLATNCPDPSVNTNDAQNPCKTKRRKRRKDKKNKMQLLALGNAATSGHSLQVNTVSTTTSTSFNINQTLPQGKRVVPPTLKKPYAKPKQKQNKRNQKKVLPAQTSNSLVPQSHVVVGQGRTVPFAPILIVPPTGKKQCVQKQNMPNQNNILPAQTLNSNAVVGHGQPIPLATLSHTFTPSLMPVNNVPLLHLPPILNMMYRDPRYTSDDTRRNNVRLRPIAIDGSNVAFAHGKETRFSCKGIEICIDFFLKRGHTAVKAFVPQFRRKKARDITDQHILEKLSRGQQYIVFTPSREIGSRLVSCYDDRFVLDYAIETNGIMVSNDNYRDLMRESVLYKDVIEKRLLMFTFVDDLFMVPKDPLGRLGPTLDTFLTLPP